MSGEISAAPEKAIKISMSSGGPGNPRRTPSWEKYERLRNGHEESEMEHGVSNIPPTNAAPDGDVVVGGDAVVKNGDVFDIPHKNGDVFDIPHKNASLESLRKWKII